MSQCGLAMHIELFEHLQGGLGHPSRMIRPRSAYWSSAKPPSRAKAQEATRASEPLFLRRSRAKLQKKPLWKPKKEWDSSPLTLQERQDQVKRNAQGSHSSIPKNHTPNTDR